MDEASSKFVDQIALAKLLDEKLRRVTHDPSEGLAVGQELLFTALDEHPLRLDEPRPTATGWSFRSPLPDAHPENGAFEVRVTRAAEPRGSIVLLHGLFEDNRSIHDFLVRGLALEGLDVFQPSLPFHYERKPQESLFGGEYFWSARFARTVHAFRQALVELDRLERWVRETTVQPVMIGGFSMGGCVALLLASQRPDLGAVVALNPATTLSGIVWDSPLCATIKGDYLRSGYSLEQISAAYAPFEPARFSGPALPADRVYLGYSLYDQVTSPEHYESFRRRWALPRSRAYRAGHLNLLRVPRLAADIGHFFRDAVSRPESPS